jgi:hypothetical protein
VNVLAAIRPHDVDFALFVHVLGAMVLFGGLVTAAGAGILGWRDEGPRLRRFAAMSLVLVALPGWIVMRIGAEWTYSKEHLDALPKDPAWLGIGFITADLGGLLLLIALITGGIGHARGRDALLRASTAIAALLVVFYVVAIWAMGGKPS